MFCRFIERKTLQRATFVVSYLLVKAPYLNSKNTKKPKYWRSQWSRQKLKTRLFTLCVVLYFTNYCNAFPVRCHLLSYFQKAFSGINYFCSFLNSFKVFNNVKDVCFYCRCFWFKCGKLLAVVLSCILGRLARPRSSSQVVSLSNVMTIAGHHVCIL